MTYKRSPQSASQKPQVASFLSGISSVLEVMPHAETHNRKPSLRIQTIEKRSPRNDLKAIQSDWAAIHSDFVKAVFRFKRERSLK
jgi:hypothetical protein